MSALLLSAAMRWGDVKTRAEVLLVTPDKMAHAGLRALLHTLSGGGACCQVVETPADALAACTPKTSLVVWMVSRHAARWLVLTDVLSGVFAWLGTVCGGVTVVPANLAPLPLSRLLQCLLQNRRIPADIPQGVPVSPLTKRQRQALMRMLFPERPATDALRRRSESPSACRRWRISVFLQTNNLRSLACYPGLPSELLNMMPSGGGVTPAPVVCLVTDMPLVAAGVRHLLQGGAPAPVILTLSEVPRYLPPGCRQVIWVRSGACPLRDDLMAMRNVAPALRQIVLTLKTQVTVRLPGVEHAPLSSPLCRLRRLLVPGGTQADREEMP